MFRLTKYSLYIIPIVIIFNFYKCPIKLFFNIDCPGCGMTRAYIMLLKLDMISAFRYHQLFPLPIIVMIYQLFHEQLNIGKRNEMICMILILITFLIRWLFLL